MEYLIIGESLIVFVALYIVYTSIGATARRYPVVLFFVGILIAVLGAAVNYLNDYLLTSFSQLSQMHVMTEPAGVNAFGELIKKVIEIGFAAVGAGLVCLAIDIRSDGKLDEAREFALWEKERFEEDRERFYAMPKPTKEEFDRRMDAVERLQKRQHELEKSLNRLIGYGRWMWRFDAEALAEQKEKNKAP